VPVDSISSWRDIDEALGQRSWLASGDDVHPPLVYRGLGRSSYRNVHSLSRLHADFRELERPLLRSFRKYAHREQPGPSIWDWLSLAQHHGLPTRLLDWTYSPLVALHFATLSAPEDEGVLWEVDCAAAHERLPDPLRDALSEERARIFTTELLDELAGSLERLDDLGGDEPFVLFFEPPSLDERIVNQAAVLSIASSPELQVEDWLGEHDDVWRAWRIPGEVKPEIRARLDQANVTERVLMPGLDGLAAWLCRYYSPLPQAGDRAEGGTSMSHQPA